MKPGEARRNQPQDFRCDFVFGKVNEIGPERVGDDLIKATLIDKPAIDQGPFDILAVQVCLLEDVIDL